MALPIAAAALLPILKKAGTGILARVIEKRAPGAAEVVKEIGSVLGLPNPTPGAIVEAFEHEPGPVLEAAVAVESADPERWRYLADAEANRSALLKREDERESAFSWAWRPAMSWLLIVLWAWNGLLLSVVNAIARSSIAGMSVPDLVAFSGIWLAIYGGGHTVKSVMDARAAAKQ